MPDTLLPLIPSEWQLAIQRLEVWRQAAPLTMHQWNILVDWLTHSSFGEKSYMAGELGAQLIHDFSSDTVLDQFLSLSSHNSWVIHFQNIAASGRQHPRRSLLLTRASQDAHLVVRSYARSVLNTVDVEIPESELLPMLSKLVVSSSLSNDMPLNRVIAQFQVAP